MGAVGRSWSWPMDAASSTRSGATTTPAGIDSLGLHASSAESRNLGAWCFCNCRRSASGLEKHGGPCSLVAPMRAALYRSARRGRVAEQFEPSVCRIILDLWAAVALPDAHVLPASGLCVFESLLEGLPGGSGSVPWEFDEWWAVDRRGRNCTAPRREGKSDQDASCALGRSRS